MFDGRIGNAPHVPRGRSLLDARAMVRNPVALFERYRARLGPTFTLHFGGVKPSVVSTDPVVLEHVLRGNRDNYEKSYIQVERMVEFQGEGVVNIHGEAWFRQRKLLAQGFKPAYLAKLVPMQQDVLQELMRDFDREALQGPVDVRQQMLRFTLRLVGKSLFGRSMRTDELEQIADIISAIQAFVHRQIIQPWKIPWFRLSGQSARYQQLRRDGDAIALRHIRARMKEGLSEDDILRILLETPYHDTGKPMDEPLVLIESLQLLVAGNQTSSNALTWIFYLLARHPKYILEIRDEVAAVIGDNAMDYHNLHGLEGTVRVIDEALRLYPPFWMIDRIALKDDEIGGVHIPAGAMVIPYIYGAHRNPAQWQDVETFDPRRFEPDRSKERHPFAYIPFGRGPRICLGANLAVMQMIMIVAAVVRQYDFAMVTNEPVAIDPIMLLRPRGPVTMRFQALKHTKDSSARATPSTASME
jgi:cytochrome P450